MRLRLVVIVASVCCFLVSAQPLFSAKTSNATCNPPSGLAEKLAKEYPGSHVLGLGDMEEYDRKLFRKGHGARCPGLVKVNFYGDGKPTWALVLTAGEHPHRKVELIVARQLPDGWEVRSLVTTDGAPVIWREGPGKYEDIYGDRTIRATRPVIVSCDYGSSAIVYAWMGDRVDKVWLSD